MIRKIKIGIVLMLIGIGIPTVLMFFKQNGGLFYLNVIEQVSLKDTEIDTLNSIYDLSEALKQYDIGADLKKISEDKKISFEAFADLNILADKLDKVKKDIDVLLTEADGFRLNESGGKLGKYVHLTPIHLKSKVAIPFNYFIGIGLMLCIIGMGFIIVPLIGRKGRKP